MRLAALGVALGVARRPTPPAERQAKGMAPCAQAPARVGVRRGGLRVQGGSSALDVRGPRRHGIVDPSSPSVCRHHRCSRQPGSGQLAPRSWDHHVMSGSVDMTCSGRSNEFQAWTRACRSLSHPGQAGNQPRGRSCHRQSRIPGVDRLLVALVALVGLDARVCEILDPKSRPHPITNCTCCIPPQATLLALQPTPRAVIDFVYSLRICPMLCGHHTRGLQRQRSAIFGSVRRSEMQNQRLAPAESRARRVSTLAANKSQELAPFDSCTSFHP